MTRRGKEQSVLILAEELFLPDELKAAKRRIAELSAGDTIATAVSETIEAIEASTLMVVNASLAEI
ncbi:MAG: hypothetical protein MUC51_07880 [Anaerolineae bacterium]|jgi:hypothetical protein|nr:hypothetical protein [Anaerolineae bacterium]